MNKSVAIQAWSLMSQAKRWLIATHFNPDGDALGSTNIFLELAAAINKPAVAYCASAPDENFRFLSRISQLTNKITKEQFDDFDLIIIVDCATASRSKLKDWLYTRRSDQTVIEFDHHERQEDYADIEFKESEAAATVEIIYNFLLAIDWPINVEIAKSILAGLLTDTGNFIYSNTSDRITKIAAKMMLMGARVPKIVGQTLTNKNLAVMHLWGRVLSRLKINYEYLVAIAVVKHNELSEFGLGVDDLSGLIGLISGLQGVVGTLLLIETESGQIKGSLRSRLTDIDMSMLANFLGGGGHRQAAGFCLNGSLSGEDGQIVVL